MLNRYSFLCTYPNLNANWFITGEGPQWNDGEGNYQPTAEVPSAQDLPSDEERRNLLLVKLQLRELERVADRMEAYDPE